MNIKNVSCVILIAGPQKGTRLRPLSFDTPKALFPLAGKSILEHQIEALLKIKNLKNIILVGNFDNFNLPETFSKIDIPISYINEGALKGTAGTLYFLYQNNKIDFDHHLLVCHCDVVCNYPFDQLIQNAKFDQNYIVSTKVPKDVSHHFGCMITKNDQIIHYVEKPSIFTSDQIYAGISLFCPSIFNTLKLISIGNNPFDLGDLFPVLVDRKSLFSFPLQGFWCSVKSPDSALFANSMLLEANEIFVHPSSEVDSSAVIGPHVSIGSNCQVKSGARIVNSIIFGDCVIHENSILKNCIVCSKCQIGAWCRVEGQKRDKIFECYPKTKNNHSYFSHDGKKNPSITILGSNVQVKNNSVIYSSIILPYKDISFDCFSEIFFLMINLIN